MVVPVYRSAGTQYSIVGIAESGTSRGFAASIGNTVAIGAPNLPDTHDLYLIRDVARSDDPDGAPAVFAEHDGQNLLSLDEGLVVAIPANASIEDFRLPVTTHGHNRKMLPDRALLRWGDDTATAAATPLFQELQPATEQRRTDARADSRSTGQGPNRATQRSHTRRRQPHQEPPHSPR